MSNKMALDALTACPFCGKSNTLVIGKASDVFTEPDECGDPLPYMHTESYAVTCDASKPDGPGGCGASGGYKLTEAEAVSAWNARAAIAALEAEPQDGDVEQALNRMDSLLDPSLNLLAVSENSITLQGCRADMLTIRRALRMAPAAREGWQPIETAPKDGTDILLAIIDADHSYIDHVERGYFEVVAEDEEDGPWDIRNGEPWCSYEGRSEGLYWCYACGPDDFNRRGIRFLDCSDCLKYTHWMPLPATPPKD